MKVKELIEEIVVPEKMRIFQLKKQGVDFIWCDQENQAIEFYRQLNSIGVGFSSDILNATPPDPTVFKDIRDRYLIELKKVAHKAISRSMKDVGMEFVPQLIQCAKHDYAISDRDLMFYKTQLSSTSTLFQSAEKTPEVQQPAAGFEKKIIIDERRITPRNLLDESSIPADAFHKTGNFEKRRAVLHDTVDKLSTAEKRAHCHRIAQNNHHDWSEAPSIRPAKTVRVIAGDWGEVTQRLSKETGAIYAALNMANAFEPGGGYLEGWGAQEENMFRRSDCHFHVTDDLMNAEKDHYTSEMTDLINAENGRVYFDRKPRICIKGKEDTKASNLGYLDLPENEYFLFYELRSAADNLDPTHEGHATKPFEPESMRRKIAAQLDTLIHHGIRHVVLSAFGCGAFANPADQVAQIYKEEIQKRIGHFDDMGFAVFYAGYGPDNFTPFQQILDGLPLSQSSVLKPASRSKINVSLNINKQPDPRLGFDEFEDLYIDREVNTENPNEYKLTFALDGFQQGSKIVDKMIRDKSMIEDSTSAAQEYLKGIWYYYNEKTHRLVLVSPPIDHRPYNEIVISQICDFLLATCGEKAVVENVVAIDPNGGTVVGRVNVETYLVSGKEVKKQNGFSFCESENNGSLVLATMLLFAQYACHTLKTSVESLSSFLSHTRKALERVVSAGRTAKDFKEMIHSIITTPALLSNDSDNIKVIDISLHALKLSYEKRVKTGEKYLGLLGFFGYSAKEKLVALNEYLEKGSTSQKAAKQGLLKELIDACEEIKKATPSKGLPHAPQ